MSPEEMSRVLARAYWLVGELWCSPQDVQAGGLKDQAQEVVADLASRNPEVASRLSRFLAHYPPAEERYVELFELNPLCPLYLGSHVFEEPKTCAQAAVSDRNEYMLELIGVYKHFGLALKGRELPDYLPLMVEALALTAQTQDPLRAKFIEEYILPFLPALRSKLQALQTPYVHLLDALEGLLRWEREAQMRQVASCG